MNYSVSLNFIFALILTFHILNSVVMAEDNKYDMRNPELWSLDIDGLQYDGGEVEKNDRNLFNSSIGSFIDNSVITLMHEVALPTRNFDETVNNRSSVRVEYEKYFFKNYFLRFDTKLIGFYANDHRAEADGSDFYFETTVREAYLQYSSGVNSWKFGQQVLIWGESDVGAITDVISPRNVSELFFISLEESRIGQLVFTWDRFTSSGDWSFFFVPFPRLNTYPDPGTAYFIDPFAGQFVEEEKDAGQEFGGRWKKTFGVLDLSFMAASLVDNDYLYQLEGVATDGRLHVDKERRRYSMAGLAFIASRGDFLFTGETAYKFSKSLTNSKFDIVERDVIEASLRAEYSLGKSGSHSISLEIADSYIVNWDENTSPTPESNYSIVIGWNNTFFNDNLSINFLSLYNTPYTNWQHSLFTTYKVSDRISVKMDAFYMTVWDDRSDYYSFRNKNSIVFRILYQF